MDEEKKKSIIEALETIHFFPPLKDEDKADLAEKFQLVEYPKGTVIFAEGDPGDFLYILYKGSVQVFVKEGDKKRVIAQLREKELIGEMALVTGEPRTASVETKEDCVLVALNKNDFDQLLAAKPSLAVNLTKVISRRLMHAAKPAKAEEEKKKEILTIYSATGRSGKTTLAVSLAALIAKQNGKVLLADFNFQFGHLGLMLNIKPELTIYDLAQKKTIDMDLFVQHTKETEYGFSVLFAPLHIAEAEVIEEEKVIEILSLAKEHFDVVIVDTGEAITPPTLAAMDHATKLVYVFEPDMFSLRDAKECLEVMRSLEYPDEKIFLVKHVPSKSDTTLTNDKVQEFLGFSIRGEFPEEGAVRQMIGGGKIPVLESAKSPYTQALKKILADLLGEGDSAEQKEKKGEGGFLKGLFGKK